MQATRNADGTLTIPKRAEGGGLIGDGMVTIGPKDSDYPAWDAWLKGQEREKKASDS